MGKLMKLKDGTEYIATIASSITSVQIPVNNYADVDAVIKKLTVKNLSEVEFDGKTYTDLVYDGVTTHSTNTGAVATFAFSLGVEDRIEEEVQAAIDAYTMQLIEEGVL